MIVIVRKTISPIVDKPVYGVAYNRYSVPVASFQSDILSVRTSVSILLLVVCFGVDLLGTPLVETVSI